MVRFVLDTNVCIQIIRGRSTQLHSRLAEVSRDDLAISAIVWAELLVGAYLSPRGYEQERTKLAPFLELVQLPFDQNAAEHYAEIRAYLQARGQLIGERDLMIAATTRAQGLTLATHNTREFERVPDLMLEDWELP
jgi:tRNA(fMet)-specific endonuclease VapC